MKLYSAINKVIVTSLICVFLALFVALALTPGLSAFASEEAPSFDNGDVKTELSQMGFNLEEYPFNREGKVSVFSFMEYGYSEYLNETKDYGLYFYVYNPRELDFDFTSNKNLVQLGVTYDKNGACIDYEKFQLELVDSADNGRYIKLKVKAGLSRIHEIVKGSERRYDVSGIELCKKGFLNAEEYSIATTFYYTGYAKGFARDVNAESTLSCSKVELETIELNVKHTTYKIWNVDNTSGQELATVYFNVPEKYFDSYGNLQKIKAEWLYSITDYIYCCSYQDLYNKLLPYVGKTVEYEKDLPYCFYRLMEVGLNGYDTYVHGAYNVKSGVFTHVMSRITTINWLMPAFNNSPEELLNYVEVTENKDNLFSHVDSEKTVKVIDAGDLYDLKGLDGNHSGWEWLWEFLGFTETIESVCPIYTITDADCKLSNEEFAKTLKVNEVDVDNIKSMHAESGSRTVLFRFALNDFESQDLEVGASGFADLPNDFNPGRGLLYRTKLPLYQNFDVIWLGFQKNGTMTIVPAVSNPISVIGSTKPPLNNSDKDWSDESLKESVLGDDWNKFVEALKEAGKWIGIVLLCILFVVIVIYLLPKFIAFGKSIKSSKKSKSKSKKKKVKKNAKKVSLPKV